VDEKIEHETGRGAIVLFSTASGRQRYVSEHPVVREHWATPGTNVTFDARGRAVVEAAFEKPGAPSSSSAPTVRSRNWTP